MFLIENNGPLIVSTSYWKTERAKLGLIFCSVNAGAIRMLLPKKLASDQRILDDMDTAKVCLLTRGVLKLPAAPPAEEGIELMWDDGSVSPFAIYLTAEAFDMLPAEPPPGGRSWMVTIWVEDEATGQPRHVRTFPCYWRRADRLPYLKPYGK